MLTAATIGVRSDSIALREAITPTGDALSALRRTLRAKWSGVAVIATCNRFEVYVPGDADAEDLVGDLATASGQDPAHARRSFQVHRGSEAVRHLFRVASGLDSLVLGEYEILGQVRRELDRCGRSDLGRALEQALRSAVHVGRKVRARTGLASGRLSLFTLAADEVARRCEPDRRPRVLIVGAGFAAEQAAHALFSRGYRDFVVANRTLERAEELATALGGAAVPIDALDLSLSTADVLVGAAAAPTRLVRLAQLRRAIEGTSRSLIVVDLATPRVIDPEVSALGGVQYFHVDNLQMLARRTSRHRAESVPAAEALVDEEVHRFARWHQANEAAPAVAALAAHAEAVRRAQLAKTLQKFQGSSEQRAQIDGLTKALVKQLLHPQIEALRGASASSRRRAPAVDPRPS